jgi:SOS-response transcriptional repressor LexA
MSEQQFADAVGVSRGAVQQWEKPGGTAPKRSNQPKVAELLGMSVAQLVSGGIATGNAADMRGEVPLVTEAEAANPTLIDNSRPSSHTEHVPASVAVKRHTFALRVRGDSMVADTGDSFPEGSVIVIEPEMQAQDGDYVVVTNDVGEISFKQLVRDGGEYYLKPRNPRYPIRLLGNEEIVGVVREFSKRFR